MSSSLLFYALLISTFGITKCFICYQCFYDTEYNVGEEWNRRECMDNPASLPRTSRYPCNESHFCTFTEVYDLELQQVVAFDRRCSATPYGNTCVYETSRLRCYGSCRGIFCNENDTGNAHTHFSYSYGMTTEPFINQTSDSAYNNDTINMTNQPFIHQTSDSGYEGQVRLGGGSNYYGRVEVYSRGQWGTICDDSFDHNDVKVICRVLGLYQGENYGVAYSSAYYGSGSGPIIVDDLQCYGYESNIKQCSSSPWFSHNCDHGEDAGLDCYAYNYNQTTGFPTTTYSTYPWWLTSTYPWWHTNQPYTTTYNPWYYHTTPGYTLQDVIRVNCNEYTWSIIVDLYRLRQLYPNAKGSDIYFGENTCVGIERDGHLTFQQGFTECLTTEMLRGDVHVYMNELIYAERDPVYLYIIRHYNWTVNVECDVMRDGSVHGGFQAGTNAPKPSENSLHYPVNISYYLDPNYMQEVSGHPLHADVGSQIYVKVFTTTFDWNVRMRVHTCYTKPTPNAPDHLKYYLLKNGCEADTNTHIISQSTHETRFVFDDFEYTSNHEGLYVFCDVTFCQNQDWSQQCRQTCNPIVKRSVRLTDTKSALVPEK